MTSPPTLAYPEAPAEHSGGARVDGELKVSGRLLYSADLTVPGLLHVAVLRSPYPHARILRIDTSAAEKAPGVALVLTGAAVSELRFGRAVFDVPILAADKVRFVGEMVVAVVAGSKELAQEATLLIEVEYEPVPAVFDPVEALNPEAPALHDAPWSYAGAGRGPDAPLNLVARTLIARGGDIEEGLAASERVFEHTFRTQSQHQGYLEPHSCTVIVDAEDRINIWASNKSPYRLREQLSQALGIPVERFTVHAPPIGGDFGGKGTPMDVPLCVELALRTRQPVRMTMSSTEELMAGAPRHSSVIQVRLGTTHDGLIQALDVHTFFNAGAYGGFRPTVNHNPHAGTSYHIPVLRSLVERVYTNQLPGGNHRGPGAPQITFAVESMMDIAAQALGIAPATFRRNNLLRQGEESPFGDAWPEVRAVDTLELAESAYRPVFPKGAPRTLRFGRGFAVYDRPAHTPQHTSARFRLQSGGIVEVQVPIMETGTGSHTLVRRVAAEALGLDLEQVVIRYVATGQLPYDSGVGGSRVTITASNGAHLGALMFRKELLQQMAEALAVPTARVELQTGGIGMDTLDGRRMDLAALAARGGTVEIVVDTGEEHGGRDHEAVTSYVVQVAQVGVDTETGQVFVYEILSAHDVAEILNPIGHQSQIEGGIIGGLGFALTENLSVEEGRVTAAHLGDYKMPCIGDTPSVRVELLRGAKGMGVRNVKAIGELCTVPTAAAIANAVADAAGVRIDALPITPEKVLRALAGARQAN